MCLGFQSSLTRVPYERLLRELSTCKANGKSNSNGWKQRVKTAHINEGYLPEGYGTRGEAPQVFVSIPRVLKRCLNDLEKENEKCHKKNLAEDPNCTECSEQAKATGSFKRPEKSLMDGPVNGG